MATTINEEREVLELVLSVTAIIQVQDRSQFAILKFINRYGNKIAVFSNKVVRESDEKANFCSIQVNIWFIFSGPGTKKNICLFAVVISCSHGNLFADKSESGTRQVLRVFVSKIAAKRIRIFEIQI